jgi:chromosome segregation ATPase
MAIALLVVTAVAILALRREVDRWAERLEEVQVAKAALLRELETLHDERRALEAEIAKREQERAAATADRDAALRKRDAADKAWREAEARARREAALVEAEHSARDAWQDRVATATAAMQHAMREAKDAKAALEDAKRQLLEARAKLQRLDMERLQLQLQPPTGETPAKP